MQAPPFWKKTSALSCILCCEKVTCFLTLLMSNWERALLSTFYQIRPSRKLARECKCNVEVCGCLVNYIWISYHIRLSQREQRQYNKSIQGVQQVLHETKAFFKVLYLYRWQQVQGSQC